jgi:hypothetical protein
MLGGVLAGMGIYRAGAGPVGGVFSYLSSLAFGRLEIVVPPAVVAAGILVIVASGLYVIWRERVRAR